MPLKAENIERLYDRYARSLYYTCLRITANAEDAEEAMHDAFIKYFQMRPNMEVRNIQAWLKRVCIRNSIDILRKRRTDEFIFSEMTASESQELMNMTDEGETETEYSVEKINEAMGELPEGYRLILSLHLFEGFDYEEIAQITGLRESSVRSQYMRGRKKLTEILRMKSNLMKYGKSGTIHKK